MRRAVIFITLALLLLAVAGVTVAQEGAFDAGDLTGNTMGTTVWEDTAPPLESTKPERTVPESNTLEATTPSVENDAKEESPTQGEAQDAPPPEEPRKPGGRDQDDGVAGSGSTGTNEGRGYGKGVGRPESSGRPENAGKGPNGRAVLPAVQADEEAENGDGGVQEKVTVCHKGKKTLSVGAQAINAHLRHGDAVGVCG